MSRVGWIGLGKLGTPMARHVVAAGHEMRAVDRDPSRLAAVPGAADGKSVAEIAGWADIVVSSVPDDAALRSVALGPDGVIARLADGAVFVETSTVSPDICTAVRVEADARGAMYLASPVSGSTVTAEAAALTLFCSGPDEAFSTARAVLSAFASSLRHVGPTAEARYLKLAINHFIGTTAQVAAEALALARLGGVEWNQLLDVLGSSAAASPLIKYKLDPLRRRDFAPAFSVDQIGKDMALAVAAGAEVGIDMPLAALVRDAFARQAAAGLADLDFFAAVLDGEARAGLPPP